MADDFLARFQECIDREEPLALDMRLEDIAEWDSLSAMAFIGLANSAYGKRLKLTDLAKAKTVGDLHALVS